MPGPFILVVHRFKSTSNRESVSQDDIIRQILSLLSSLSDQLFNIESRKKML